MSDPDPDSSTGVDPGTGRDATESGTGAASDQHDADRGTPGTRGADRDTPGTDVVVAQGTFDILHPGHLHYLREAASMGDRLVVIVARSGNVTHKESPIVPEQQRREMVAALDPVDEARLGHPEDIFVPIERLDPAVIVLGHDQHHDADSIETALRERGIDCDVRRASERSSRTGTELLSTGRIVDRIIAERSTEDVPGSD